MEGIVRAELVSLVSHQFTPEQQEKDCEKINALKSGPLVPQTPETVHIRRMRLTGNQMNAYYGRFRDQDLPKVAELTIGAPVLTGHDKTMLPVGRYFDGEVIEEQGKLFTLNGFYFPREWSGAQDLASRIDSGVVSECSISFQCDQITCGLDGLDIRDMDCPHIPGKEYPAGGLCFYWYDGIERVLEGSLVYRGAHPDTGFGQLLHELSIESAKDWVPLFEKWKGLRGQKNRWVLVNGVEMLRGVK